MLSNLPKPLRIILSLTKCILMLHITGPNTAIYGQYYSRANYHNIRGFTKWNEKALEAIRLNMKDQHTEMKRQLQERHKDIANHVGQDVSDTSLVIYTLHPRY